MLVLKRGADIFRCGADMLVNPVNTVGVSGKGLALKFKEIYPTNFVKYRDGCRHGWFNESRRVLLTSPRGKQDCFIANLATKDDWRDGSNISMVRVGLDNLTGYLRRLPEVSSVAIPALGCGLGGLRWEDVFPEIEAFAALNDSREIIVIPPK